MTIVTCMNATFTYVPPLLVFSGNRVKAELLDRPPQGSIAACHKAGWIQQDSFTQRFKYFLRFVKPSKKHPVILTLGGHYSHSRTIEVINSARENGVHIIFPPPHSTYKLQPLGLFFYLFCLCTTRASPVVFHGIFTGIIIIIFFFS